MDRRRELDFESLEDVLPDVERLLRGHTTAGAWSLGQILHHLDTAIRLTLGGGQGLAASGPEPARERAFEVRRRRFFQVGRFPEGGKLPVPALDPPDGLDDRVEAEKLRATILAFDATDGPFQIHPYLGPLAKDEWATFHRIHCAHHLSFAIPASPLTNQ